MQQHTFFFILITFLLSCGSNDQQKKNNSLLIEEIESKGYKYLGDADPPSGISDTMLSGYTDRVDNIYYNRTEKFKSLNINGFKFEESADVKDKKILLIYQFDFKEKKEKERFEKFQNFILNYQRHSKNNTEFFQKDTTWYLRFEPMP